VRWPKPYSASPYKLKRVFVGLFSEAVELQAKR
jgi:hypothetical protein